MSRFTSLVQNATGLAPRGGAWLGRQGPVSLSWGGTRAALRPLIEKYPWTDYQGCIHLKDQCDVPVVPTPNMGDMPVSDLGDIGSLSPTATGEEIKLWHQCVTETTFMIAEKGFVPMFVGGKQDTSISAIEGLKRVHRDDIVFVHFGAQPVCSTSNTASRSDQTVNLLFQKKLIKGCMQFGTREVSREDRNVRQNLNVKSWDANAMYSMNLSLARNIRNEFNLYISVDASVFDPCYFTGAQTKIGGGLTLREVVHLFVALRAPRIIGVDIVGLSETRSESDDVLVAKLAKELIQKVYAMSPMTAEEISKEVQRMRQAGAGLPSG